MRQPYGSLESKIRKEGLLNVRALALVTILSGHSPGETGGYPLANLWGFGLFLL